MVTRGAHRARWILVAAFFVMWSVALMLDLGGGLANVLLVLAAVVLLYELLAVDRAA